jgi:hypothetical protein
MNAQEVIKVPRTASINMVIWKDFSQGSMKHLTFFLLFALSLHCLASTNSNVQEFSAPSRNVQIIGHREVFHYLHFIRKSLVLSLLLGDRLSNMDPIWKYIAYGNFLKLFNANSAALTDYELAWINARLPEKGNIRAYGMNAK